ncbi:MAG: helix-turn-helix transcriptional regulator [Candidatus Aminicenantes bacterium]|jgi:transcriptional regulator with XRE-family HTH domain
MCELEIKKEIGQRFRVFRQAIGKKQIQLARELKVSPSAITFIEQGTCFPKFNYINYLHGYYRLNIDWLLGSDVPMFLPVAREGKACASFLSCHIPYHDPVYGMYVELMELMEVPGVERSILKEAARIKRLFKKSRRH